MSYSRGSREYKRIFQGEKIKPSKGAWCMEEATRNELKHVVRVRNENLRLERKARPGQDNRRGYKPLEEISRLSSG